MDELHPRGEITASHIFAVDVPGHIHQGMSLGNLGQVGKHLDWQQWRKKKTQILCFKENTEAARCFLPDSNQEIETAREREESELVTGSHEDIPQRSILYKKKKNIVENM